MSHAELVRDGLFFFIAFLTLLLLLFIGAAVRAPAEPAGSRQPAGPPIQPDPEPPELAWPRAAATWPPVGAASLSSDSEYLPRHATPGGPPWGPAPRPPGLID